MVGKMDDCIKLDNTMRIYCKRHNHNLSHGKLYFSILHTRINCEGKSRM